MRIRSYRPEDCEAMAELFYQTVHTVNARDYSSEQLDAWASGKVDLASWNTSFLMHHTLVAEEDGRLIGFSDMDQNGYLDRLYIHKDHQGCGIAKTLVHNLENDAGFSGITTFETYASITARPFFEHLGYQVVRENFVERNGIYLKNYLMRKISDQT